MLNENAKNDADWITSRASHFAPFDAFTLSLDPVVGLQMSKTSGGMASR